MAQDALVRCCGQALRFEVYPPDMPPCPWEPSPDWTVGSDVSGALTVSPGDGVSVEEISGGAGYKLYIWNVGFTHDRLYDFGINWQWGWWRQNQITHEYEQILYPVPAHYRVPVGNLDCSHGLGQECPPGCDCPGGGSWGDLPGTTVGAVGGGAGGPGAARHHAGGPAGGDGGGWLGGRGAALQGPSQGDPVNPWNGIELYQPASDLIVANRTTAAVGFDRFWSNRHAVNWYGTPGLASGWTHNWDYFLRDLGSPGTWHDLALVMPSGSSITLQVELDSQGQPTGALLPPADAFCLASGTPSSTAGEWEQCRITWRDGSNYVFEPHATGVYALTRLTNALGQAVDCAYDDDRRLLTLSDPTSSALLLELTYRDGYLTQIHDLAGRQVAYLHEPQTVTGEGTVMALREVSLVSPLDEDQPLLRSRFAYLDVPSLGYDYGYGDRLLLLTSITAPSPNGDAATAYIRYFETSYRVAETEDANGNVTFYYTQADGTVTTYQMSPSGEFVKQTDTTYDANGAVTSSTCTGCATSIAYDDPSFPYLPTAVTAADGKVTTYTYDEFGNVLTTTDPRDIVITNTWDYDDFALGRLVRVERTVDNDTITLAEYTYDAASGLVLTASSLAPGTTTGELVTTTTTYDDLGNPLTVTAPGNNADATIVTTYEYETDGAYSQAAAVGQPLYVEDNLGHRTHFRYDGRGNRTLVTDALGHTWETTYNLADQVVSTQQPATGQQGSGRVTVQYDYVFPGGPRTDVTVLDEAGAVVQHINHQLGAEGEILAVTGGTEAVSYEYDALYRQVLLTDGNGHSTIFRYDSKGRLALIRYPLANADTGADTVRFTLYDDAGRLLRRIDGRDIVTEYDYDEPGGALTAIRYPADPDSDVEFTYDALGRRIAMTDPTGAHAYTYDDGGRLLSQEVTYTGLDAKTIAYEYYPNGSRSKLTTPAGDYDYTYDAGGRLTALEYDLGTAEWTYLDNGALATQTLPNGCVSSYDYNAANQLVGLLNQAPDSSTLSSYGTMTYRGTGDLTTVTSTIPGASSLAGVVDYAYDLKRQLTAEDSTRDGGYDFGNTFDAAGNATTFRDGTQIFNANNQLTGPGTYVYDGNGNPTTFAVTALTWDHENRLTSHGTALDAAYRGDGLRAWKEGTARTYFLYDGINVVCELDADGDVIASSTFGAAGLLSRGAVEYQFDPLGDAVHLLDGDGAVLANRLFDAWGNELTTGPFNPRGYRARYGYYTDEETGLIALAYRYYAPGVGRFLNRDPIGYGGGVNVYGYVGAMPIASADTSGLLFGCETEPSYSRCQACCGNWIAGIFWAAVGPAVVTIAWCVFALHSPLREVPSLPGQYRSQ